MSFDCIKDGIAVVYSNQVKKGSIQIRQMGCQGSRKHVIINLQRWLLVHQIIEFIFVITTHNSVRIF